MSNCYKSCYNLVITHQIQIGIILHKTLIYNLTDKYNYFPQMTGSFLADPKLKSYML
ncbi:hypothetical protein Hanom_Chr09g00820071 [Helianthus anomalus]